MKRKYYLSVVLFLISSCVVISQIKLPAIISSDMVLQRNTEVSLWGWADKQERIKLEASWLSEPLDIKADREGRWSAKLTTTLSKEPQRIRLTGKKSDILLENILFGEVWLCSGQSNMQHPVKGLPGQPTFGSQEAIMHSYNPNLRLFSVGRVGSLTPLDNLQEFESWAASTPKNAKDFSAIGYFFADQLQRLLDVPVGIIHSSWGGSMVEPWISKEVIDTFAEDDLLVTDGMNHTPTALFNAMIRPLIPYTLKGFLWYQGESNRRKPEAYKGLFPAMVQDWRTRWDLPDAPFYFTQIAPFHYGKDVNAFQEVGNSAFIREAQLHCVDAIPNSGIAITLDIGDSLSIHPPRKKEVADRLLGLALAETYGFDGLNPQSPVFKSAEVQDGQLLLTFDHAEDGVYASGDLTGFEIAGEDHIFYPAEAKVEKRKQVLVWSDEVKDPVAVRYAWSSYVEGTLFGVNMLPVSSFRSDDWEDARRIGDN